MLRRLAVRWRHAVAGSGDIMQAALTNNNHYRSLVRSVVLSSGLSLLDQLICYRLSVQPAQLVSAQLAVQPAQLVSAQLVVQPVQLVSAQLVAQPAQLVSAQLAVQPVQLVSAQLVVQPAQPDSTQLVESLAQSMMPLVQIVSAQSASRENLMVLLAPLVSVVEPPAQLTSVRMVAMPQQLAVVLQQLVVSPAQMASG